MKAALLIDGWAGRREYPVEVLAETPKRFRVRLLSDALLPSRGLTQAGEIVLVPKHAVTFTQEGDQE